MQPIVAPEQKEDDLSGIPVNEMFAVTGANLQKVLEIVQIVKSRDRSRIYNLRFIDAHTLYDELKKSEQVKVEHLDNASPDVKAAALKMAEEVRKAQEAAKAANP